MASPQHYLVIDDTPCSAAWCEGPTLAWKQLKESGCIIENKAVGMDPSRGFSVGAFNAAMCL